jgi:hypothetical protein
MIKELDFFLSTVAKELSAWIHHSLIPRLGARVMLGRPKATTSPPQIHWAKLQCRPIHRPGRCIRSAAHPRVPFGPAHIRWSTVSSPFRLAVSSSTSFRPAPPPDPVLVLRLRVRPLLRSSSAVRLRLRHFFARVLGFFVSVDGGGRSVSLASFARTGNYFDSL